MVIQSKNNLFSKSLSIYTYWSGKQNCDPILFTYKACCLYSLGKYKEAYDEADLGPKDDELTNRLKFHCAFKLKIGVAVIDYHLKLTKSTADKLSLAAHQYMKGEYEEAIQIYKNIYVDKKYDALNVYLAMCYYKLELYDIALDLVNHYLTNHKSSVIAVNLKAAIEYQSSGNCKAAQNIILTLKEHTKSENFLEKDDLLLHNMTVFDNDEWNSNSKKLKVFRQLVDVLPESKLNLIIYYLKNDSVVQAYNLIKDMQPNTTKEYILKAIVHCLLGQQSDKNQDNLKKAKTYFQNVGASNVECDTIEGRQCMAACLRLIGLFNEEIIYLESIEVFMKDDDVFNWNYGIALASCQKYKEAEEVFLRITKEKYKVRFNKKRLIRYIYLGYVDAIL